MNLDNIDLALITGRTASVVSAEALALLGRVEEKGAVQPINATSHWLHGDEASPAHAAGFCSPLLGCATDHASRDFLGCAVRGLACHSAGNRRSRRLRFNA
jgi:hypothetical protein